MALTKVSPSLVSSTEQFVFANATVTGNLTTGNISTGNVSVDRLTTTSGLFWSNGTAFSSGGGGSGVSSSLAAGYALIFGGF
jgi:hypothetical protein